MRNLSALEWMTLLCLGLCLALSTSALGQGQVIIFEEESIEGEIEKPEAFYILSPSNLEYEPVNPEESFLDELDETVRSPLF